MGNKIGHYRFDPYDGTRNPFPTVGSTPGDAPEDLTYIRQSELDRLRDRLAAIERQVIYRTEDMPEWAVAWNKAASGRYCWYVGLHIAQEADNPTPQPAPDLRPDENGPLWLPIIDAQKDGDDG